jgi:hypothetical protein
VKCSKGSPGRSWTQGSDFSNMPFDICGQKKASGSQLFGGPSPLRGGGWRSCLCRQASSRRREWRAARKTLHQLLGPMPFSRCLMTVPGVASATKGNAKAYEKALSCELHSRVVKGCLLFSFCPWGSACGTYVGNRQYGGIAYFLRRTVAAPSGSSGHAPNDHSLSLDMKKCTP